ncbi:exopolysaccharide biosynthesis polyprenyl glycosylphosphotransferase [Qipengyuania gaetbuli]|uniref:exopolysaccharide biosynthesis polyprenyl glycosylphosphotransferase n=1 Tax=Qipengyuania gaetbuli TaxID=266952 RepID=UPI001C999685|nr:exopolysaccharide biosynthesis polyprenyl glycosylphosphotransferase [Qipengyuania gaetbuli]MBY6016095.1 exopolysaccharide biosynthesis polyprenyl glycosylphosphotransferase [Qipengyuania gaetbuli]
MLLAREPLVSSGRSFFHTLRFELILIFVCGIWLPASLALAVNSSGLPALLGLVGDHLLASGNTTRNSLLIACFAALGMVVTLRRFRQYPGTRVAQSILPVLAAFYGAALALVLFLRLEYSNALIVSCFLGTLVARYAIETLHVRAKGIFYSVVPGGKVDRILGLPRMPTLVLSTPSAEGLPPGPIIADLHADLDPAWERFLAEAAISGRPVYHYRQVWEAETGRVRISHLSENSFGALIPSLIYQKMKRTIDVVASIVLMPIVLPLIAASALAIKLDSKGPVFFRQRRMGFRGKVFHVLKLRTMTVTHDGADRTSSITSGDDQRITPVGRFLRRTRLDELPQIFNILAGQMSWIGPRPEAVALSEWYEAEIPFYRYRHIVRPGITGWAQVNQGHVASLDEVHAKLQYDFYYVKNLSYWLDIVIALRTLRVVLSGFGAK